MQQLIPIPPNAPPVPTVRKMKIGEEWKHYTLTHTWPYHDQTGSILGYVVRYETDTGKQVVPLTLWDEDGALKWRFKGFPKPRPLCGLRELAHNPGATVIIVEGEKCRELLQGLIDAAGRGDRLTVMCWMGGTGGVKHVDWTPLHGRKLIFWPDNDDPGREAVLTIAGFLRDHCEMKTLSIPGDRASGWDVADGILESGWQIADVIKFINDNLSDLPTNLPEQEPPPHDEPPPPAPSADIEDVLAPFACLGFNHDEYYYLPKGTQQIRSLRYSEHTPNALISLASLQYWETMYPSKAGPAWKLAASTLMRICERNQNFDVTRVRGRGIWSDRGRVVCNLGSFLLVDGKRYNHDEFTNDTQNIYERSYNMEESTDVRVLPNTDARYLLEICKKLRWENKNSAYYFAGWLVLAPICGALNWRPHCLLTGPSGSGKSWVLKHIVKKCLGDFALYVQSSTTEAGIRQTLGRDARPVVFDEFETADPHAVANIKKVLEFARAAASDSDNTILKGTVSGDASQYNTKTMFLFSAIGSALELKADITRVMSLNMAGKDSDSESAKKHFSELSGTVAYWLTDEFCASLRARVRKQLPILLKNIVIFCDVASTVLESARMGDLVGTMLAGAFTLTTDKIATPEIAEKWMTEHDLTQEKQIANADDESRCLSTLLEYPTECEGPNGKIVKLTVFELVCIAAGYNDPDTKASMNPYEIDPERAQNSLKRMGLKVDGYNGLFYIADKHATLLKVFRETQFSTSWGHILRRIEGSTKSKQERYHGTRITSTVLPRLAWYGA